MSLRARRPRRLPSPPHADLPLLLSLEKNPAIFENTLLMPSFTFQEIIKTPQSLLPFNKVFPSEIILGGVAEPFHELIHFFWVYRIRKVMHSKKKPCLPFLAMPNPP